MNCCQKYLFGKPKYKLFFTTINRNTILSILAISTLMSCGTSNNSATLESLEEKEINFAELTTSKRKMSHKKVVNAYENVVSGKVGSNDKIYQDSLRRLADLKLESGEKKNSSRSERLQSQSRVDLVSAIRQYKTFIKKYPDNSTNDEVYYQLSKAYELLGDLENALDTLNILSEKFPDNARWQEINFRRAEAMFVFGDYENAELVYATINDSDTTSIYYQRSLYKYSWSLFKQNKHQESLIPFFKLLDLKLLDNPVIEVIPGTKPLNAQNNTKLTSRNKPEKLSKSEQELIKDTTRAISLSFTYLDGAKSVSRFFKENGSRKYEYLIYKSLGELYSEKARVLDAANTYLEFINFHPLDDKAPEFHNDTILAYTQGGFTSLILPSKATFVENYGVDTAYWKSRSTRLQESLVPQLKKHLNDLSSHYHAVAKKQNKLADFNNAAKWYRLLIVSFPLASSTSKINFLLSEVLFDSRQFEKAIIEYEKTAYDYPLHPKSSTAGYAAILSYEKLIPQLTAANTILWQQKNIESSLRFASKFPKNKYVAAVLVKTSEKLFALKEYQRAADAAEQLLKNPGKKSRAKRLSAWTIIAHSRFELLDYTQAEIGYRKTLKYITKKSKNRTALVQRLAASIYKQGELYRSQNQHQQAAVHFLRVRKSVPNSSFVAAAEYDAATEYLAINQWHKAEIILLRFRKRQPKNHKLQSGVTQKFALIYTKTGQPVKAAAELETIALATSNKTESQQMLWQVTTIYKKAKLDNRSIKSYKQFIKLFPTKPQAMEARSELVAIYKKKKNRKSQWYWLKEIIRVDKKYPSSRITENKYIVANAMLTMAEPKHSAYNKVKLTTPLKKSLKRKKKLMQAAIAAYTNAINYQDADVTTSATYRIAEIYRNFASSLMKSQRPKKLTSEQLEEYELLLEEQAFPFEEKSIEIHTANLANIKDGIYNKWVKSSLKQLSILLPARYLKSENIERYSNVIH